jgi:hypothetical protein
MIMNRVAGKGISAFLMLFMFDTAIAQDYDFHPVLSDRFLLKIGAFKSNNSFNISAEGNVVNEDREINFAKALGVDQDSTVLFSEISWQIGAEKKWKLAGQYFDTSSDGSATLLEDVEWQDIKFKQGAFVEAGVDLEVVRVFVGRSLFKDEQNDFGIGFGVHNIKVGAFMLGDAELDDGTTAFRESSVDNSQPLPNIGSWYKYSPKKDWLIHGRVDWISAKIGDYDGTLWNVDVGVNYQPFRNFGIDLSLQYFDLDVGIKKNDWDGGVRVSYVGPVLSLVAVW